MQIKFDGLWRHGDFVRLWSAQTISVFGSLITGTALPFTAILVLDASPREAALLAAANHLPGLLFGLAAGVWVDRLHRRPVMIVADLGRAALLVTIPIAWAFDALTLEHLYAVALGTASLTIFFDVAYLSYVPTLVSREELVDGNSKLAATASASEFGAFSIAGWLVQAFSAPIAVLVDAVSFVVSALFVRSIKTPEPPRPPVETRTGIWAEAKDGLRAVGRDPRLRALAMAEPFNAAGLGIFSGTYLIFVTRGLDFEPGVLGVIFGLGGISSLAGATLAGRAARRFGTGPTIIAGIAMMGVSQYFIPLAQGATVFAAGCLIAQQLVGDGMYMIYDINATSLRQTIAPEEALGRVNAFMRILGLGSLLAGIVAGGEIAEAFGLRTALTIGASSMMVCAALLFVSPIRSLRAAPPPEAEPLMVEVEAYPPIV